MLWTLLAGGQSWSRGRDAIQRKICVTFVMIHLEVLMPWIYTWRELIAMQCIIIGGCKQCKLTVRGHNHFHIKSHISWEYNEQSGKNVWVHHFDVFPLLAGRCHQLHFLRKRLKSPARAPLAQAWMACSCLAGKLPPIKSQNSINQLLDCEIKVIMTFRCCNELQWSQTCKPLKRRYRCHSDCRMMGMHVQFESQGGNF